MPQEMSRDIFTMNRPLSKLSKPYSQNLVVETSNGRATKKNSRDFFAYRLGFCVTRFV